MEDFSNFEGIETGTELLETTLEGEALLTGRVARSISRSAEEFTAADQEIDHERDSNFEQNLHFDQNIANMEIKNQPDSDVESLIGMPSNYNNEFGSLGTFNLSAGMSFAGPSGISTKSVKLRRSPRIAAMKLKKQLTMIAEQNQMARQATPAKAVKKRKTSRSRSVSRKKTKSSPKIMTSATKARKSTARGKSVKRSFVEEPNRSIKMPPPAMRGRPKTPKSTPAPAKRSASRKRSVSRKRKPVKQTKNAMNRRKQPRKSAKASK